MVQHWMRKDIFGGLYMGVAKLLELMYRKKLLKE